MLANKDFEEFLKLLNDHKVRYLLVGGYAVAFHGYPRLTQDIDLFYEISAKNAVALAAVLKAFGFGSLAPLSVKDFLKSGTVIQMGHPPNRIDLLNSIAGVDFLPAWKRRIAGAYGSVPVHYIGKVDLLTNKRAAQRDKDLVDLQYLSKEKPVKKSTVKKRKRRSEVS